jgi:hypothetical protein
MTGRDEPLLPPRLAALAADPRHARWLALALGAAAAALVLVLLVLPWAAAVGGAWRRADLLERQLDADRRLVGRAAELRADLEETERLRAAAFLDGPTEALAAAGLQGRLAAMAAAAGGDLLSSETLSAEDDGGLRRLAVRASVDASPDGLRDLLHRIETAAPVLSVAALTLRPRDPQGRRLDVLLTVRGWRPVEAAR